MKSLDVMALVIATLAALVVNVSGQAAQARRPSVEVSVALSMEAHVRGVDVTLEEVARVTGSDPDLVLRVAGLSLGSAPSPGYSRVFRSERVRAAILKAHPDLRLRVGGERACRVFPEVEEISAERIAALARVRLDLELAQQDAEFELIGEVQPLSVPAGTQTLDVRVRTGELSGTRGTLSVPIEILVDGERYRTVWTAWSVKRWETREVLARAVRAGELLRSSHFERMRVQVSAGDAKALNATLLEGAVALHDLRPGEAITEGDVSRPMVVGLGESIFLEVRRGAIEARVSAVTLGSGAIGDRIRVRTVDSGQELMATIRSRDLCRLDLGSR